MGGMEGFLKEAGWAMIMSAVKKEEGRMLEAVHQGKRWHGLNNGSGPGWLSLEWVLLLISSVASRRTLDFSELQCPPL